MQDLEGSAPPHRPVAQNEAAREVPAKANEALRSVGKWEDQLGGQIKLGTGKTRSSLRIASERALEAGKSLGSKAIKRVGELVVGALFVLPGKLLGYLGEHFIARKAEALIPQVEGTPTKESSLGDLYDKVIGRLVLHSREAGTHLRKGEITDLVAVGESICKALAEKKAPPTASMYTARAVAWYVAAKAAQQDCSRGGKTFIPDLAHKGLYAMPDPGHRLHEYLASVPGAATRISSHETERSLSVKGWHGLPLQMGLEDYRSRLPGGGGAILMDKQKGPDAVDVTILKFETAGLPPVFVSGDALGTRVARFFAAWGRSADHMFNFAKTRAGATSKRTEHVHKDLLGKEVGDSFKALLTQAIDRGVISAELKPLVKHMKQFGLAPTEAILNRIVESLQLPEYGNPTVAQLETLRSTNSLLKRIAEMRAQMGGDLYGLHRKGAEVHVNPLGVGIK